MSRMDCVRSWGQISQTGKAEPDFLAVIFQFCGIGEATELGGTVQNFTKRCM